MNTTMMKCTFMIEGRVAGGQPTLGPAFILGRPIPSTTRGKYVLVTAAHVLEEMAGDSAIVHLRKQVDKENNSWIDVPTPIAIRANNQPLWMRHPEADVAVMYINVPDDEAITLQLLPTTMLADDKMLMDYDIKPGDEVRCLGYPLGVSSNDAKFPVLRSGRIASY
ncbi:MAG: hypothetical protein WAK48_30265, partial [Candidatus Acidiferrum sp.]